MASITAHHVGITVADLAGTASFYMDTFGLDHVTDFSVSGAAFAEAVDVPNATGSFVHLDAGGAVVELVEYDPAGEERGDTALNEPGAIHLGLAVDDIDAWYADLDGSVDTLSPPRTTESGASICFVRDPEGNLIEVIEAAA